jgi:putative ABC transport system ATP-binding protein
MMLAKIKQVKKNYKKGQSSVEVLRGIELLIRHGEFLSIMGPSGSGKSTLLHILGCLDRPSSGTYWLDGQKVDELSDIELSKIRNKKIGFVFQAFNLLPQVNILHNVELGMIYGGYAKSDRRRKSLELIKKVGLGDRINHYPSELSGGEQQRVAIARALACDPLLILADEPTGNLDTSSGADIMSLFKDMNSKGKTIVMVTHEEYIAAYSNRTISLKDGLVVETE